MENNCISYQLRGHRVPAKSLSQIATIAKHFSFAFDINTPIVRKMGHFIEELGEYINYDIIEDSEWIGIARALCDPSTNTIALPVTLYKDLIKGNHEAIRIFFHEVGHILLGHKAYLHFEDTDCQENEDSEWQADRFSDYISEKLNIFIKDKQLRLFR